MVLAIGMGMLLVAALAGAGEMRMEVQGQEPPLHCDNGMCWQDRGPDRRWI